MSVAYAHDSLGLAAAAFRRHALPKLDSIFQADLDSSGLGERIST